MPIVLDTNIEHHHHHPPLKISARKLTIIYHMLLVVVVKLKPYWLKSLICLEPSLLRRIPLWLKGLKLKLKDLNLSILIYTQRSILLSMTHHNIICILVIARPMLNLQLTCMIKDMCNIIILRTLIHLDLVDLHM